MFNYELYSYAFILRRSVVMKYCSPCIKAVVLVSIVILVIVIVMTITGCGGFYIEATGSLMLSDSVAIDKDTEKKRITSTEVELIRDDDASADASSVVVPPVAELPVPE